MRTLVLLCFLFGPLLSCKKEGCLDRLASNYDASARKEATCYYRGKTVLWVDETNAKKYRGQALDYVVNGLVVNQDTTLVGLTNEPGCDTHEGHTFFQDLGTSTSGVLYFKVIHNQTGKVVCDSSVTLYGGYCVAQRMVLR